MPEETTFTLLQSKIMKLGIECNMVSHAKYLIREKYGVARLSLLPASKYEELNKDLDAAIGSKL